MFDRYLICEDSLRRCTVDGQDGFSFDVRIGYYRGVRLSLVEAIDVSVDGQTIPREATRFTVKGRSHTFDEMESIVDERWEMGERATLSVQWPEGLRPGPHDVEVRELIRISYGPGHTRAADAKQLVLES